MLKKLISGIVVLVFLLVQIVPLGVFADSQDLRDALVELDDMKQSNPASVAAILGNIWEYAALENGGNGPVTSEKIYAGIKGSFDSSLWDSMVNETAPAVAGKIEKSSLMLVIDQVIERKDVIADMYAALNADFEPLIGDVALKAVIIDIVLGTDPQYNDATDAEVYVGIMGMAGEIITLSGDQFVRNGDAAKTILANIGITENIAAAVLGDRYDVNINGTIDNYAVKLNQYVADYNVDTEDVVYALEIYDLYAAPVTPTVAPGGGGVESSATPAPTATATPTPAATPANIPAEAAELVNNIINTTNDILNETDPDAALDKATDLISGSAANVQELAG